jgi:AcrR family transcriptional regulator
MDSTNDAPARARVVKSKSEEAVPHVYNNIDVGSIRRKQIIAAVRQIIARDGLDFVTIANIATELGTSRGVVVYHFKNKDEILHEVLSSAMKDANASALRFEKGDAASSSYAELIIHVANLARSSSDWWRIYFAFLSRSQVNSYYRKELAWSDDRYRKAVASKVGDAKRAAIILSLMKGLAMQAAVTPDMPIEEIGEELRILMARWLG